MDNAVDRHVFYISDGTAITAEVLGHAGTDSSLCDQLLISGYLS